MTPVFLRGYVPIASGEHPDCMCTPAPVGNLHDLRYSVFTHRVHGWLHEPHCPVTLNALEAAVKAGVA